MNIIKPGNPDLEFFFRCELCGCEFTMTAEEVVRIPWAHVNCPCCGNYIVKPSGSQHPKEEF